MKWQKRLLRITRIFLLVLTLTLPWMLTQQKASAAENNEIGSITIILDELGTPKGNVGFTAYYVGNRDNAGNWQLTDSLAATGVSLEGLTYADEWDAAALKLVEAAQNGDLSSATGKTDENGNLTFSALNWGMYLIVQNEGSDTYGSVTPFLAGIPYVGDDGIRYNDLTVHPKAKVPADAFGRIEVTKRAGNLDDESLEVVDLTPSDTTYYVGLFQDKDGKVPYGADYLHEIRMQGVSTGTTTYENLPAGTYYVFETDSEGNAYVVNEKQTDPFGTWTCKLDDGYTTQMITLDGKADGEPGKIGFYNLYDYFPDGFLYEATLNVTKQVIVDGEQTTVPDTFHVGIFRDKEATDLVYEEELKQNDQITIEGLALDGENKDQPITYYVYETDGNGNRVDASTFGYIITGEDSVDFRQGNLEETVNLVNTKKDEQPAEEPTVTPTETPGNGPSPTTTPDNRGDGTQPVKTADDTPIAMYLVIVLAAFAVIVISIGYLRGRKRHE